MPKQESITIPELTGDATINLALDTLRQGKQALVFVNTKRSAEKVAEEIAKKIKASKIELQQLSAEIKKVLSQPTSQCERLGFCAAKGIAFHHAGLVRGQRELIEEHFRKGTIKIICCTPTLAAGVDLPAYRAIIKDLMRYGHRGMDYIPVLEYLQMAGRAGRPKFDSYGEAIAIASSPGMKKAIQERYIKGEPEEILSKLAAEPILRTALLSLVASGFVSTEKEILDFFRKTFWAKQFGDFQHLTGNIKRMLALLEEWEFIDLSKQDFVAAKDYEHEPVKATVMGKRVAQLYIEPWTAHNFLVSLEQKGVKLEPFSFLQLISNTLEMRPLLSMRKKDYAEVQEKINFYTLNFLDKEPSLYDPEYDDFLRSVKTALFLQDWAEEQAEEYLLDQYNVRPGETRAKLDIADWLLYTIEEISKILNNRAVVKEAAKLRLRLKYGVKEELLPLLQLRGIGRARSRRLYNNKIKDLGDVAKADLATLSQLIGKQVALDVKKQVGQEIEEVPEGKRKGQISLGDY